jgi:hypothetical protein
LPLRLAVRIGRAERRVALHCRLAAAKPRVDGVEVELLVRRDAGRERLVEEQTLR